MTIQLPKDPKDHDYEDQIAAILLASGYYLETRLILKKGSEEVLEFDAIATPTNDYTNRRIVEVKSGSWGMPDLFKLYGQTMYTNHEAAWLIHKKATSTTKKAAIQDLSENIPVSTIHINLAEQPAKTEYEEIPEAIAMDEKLRNLIFVVAWWSRSGDRVAQGRFKAWTKSDTTEAEAIKKARVYCGQLEESLFKSSPLARADAIYDAYKKAPQLTSSLINHVVSSTGETLKQVRHSVTDTAERPHLQYIMSLEHKARIAIIKNAYDTILGEKLKTHDMLPWSEKTWDTIYKTILPSSFQEGMKCLDAHPKAQHVAFFLQVFIEVFGGFYFPDDNDELQSIAAATGIEPSEIPEMIAMLDSFFPIQYGWIYKADGDIHFIKGVPAYIRGAGCFAREYLYGKDWMQRYASSYWLPQWHNALYELLQPTLKATE